jgi:hypothetical protein
LLSENLALAPSHELWGPPLSPVDQVTASSVSCHWPPPPVTQPPAANLGPYDQLSAGPAYYPLTPLPTSPPFIGHESHPWMGPPPNFAGTALVTGPPGYTCSPGRLNSQSRHQNLAHQQTELLPFGSLPTPEYGQPEAYFPSNPKLELQCSFPGGKPAGLSPVLGAGLNGPYCQDEKRPENGEWIKDEHSAGPDRRAWWPASVEGPMKSSPVDEPPKARNESGDKSTSRRKKRARFDEGSRRATSDTRSMGACLRCHNQKVRVSGIVLDGLPLR